MLYRFGFNSRSMRICLEHLPAKKVFLDRCSSGANADYPESVATTWSLSFEKLSQTNPVAVELLYLFAFLYPDVIPEEIITDGASDLGATLQSVATDPLQLDSAVKEILRFSLLHREPDTQTFTIHRLVQAVLKDRMEKDKQRQWAERSIRAVNDAFPEVVKGQ